MPGQAVLLDVAGTGAHLESARHEPAGDEVTFRPAAEAYGEIDFLIDDIDVMIRQHQVDHEFRVAAAEFRQKRCKHALSERGAGCHPQRALRLADEIERLFAGEFELTNQRQHAGVVFAARLRRLQLTGRSLQQAEAELGFQTGNRA